MSFAQVSLLLLHVCAGHTFEEIVLSRAAQESAFEDSGLRCSRTDLVDGTDLFAMRALLRRGSCPCAFVAPGSGEMGYCRGTKGYLPAHFGAGSSFWVSMLEDEPCRCEQLAMEESTCKRWDKGRARRLRTIAANHADFRLSGYADITCLT